MICIPSLKHAAAVVGCCFIAFAAHSQAPCSEIFISEVLEGSGNNKGIEFFNPTNAPIDLSAYSIQRWAGGALAVTDETQLTGIIPALGTWVLINGQTEDVPLGGGAVSPAVDPAMLEYADQLDNPYPAPTYANGDDALVLVKNGTTVVDIFGKPGEDPGVAWTDDAANGFIDVGNGATLLTANHTLRRKYDVTGGVTLPPIVFDTFAEYDTLPMNTWDGLGQHACLCGQTAPVLYTENFDAYLSGDPITEVSEMFILWGAGTDEEAYVSNEESFSGENSLKLEATSPTNAGPTDVLLYCNVQGINEFSFKALVPQGHSGYYNFQGSLQVGQGALDCFMNSDSTVTYLIDPLSADGVELTTTYNYGQWVEFTHQIDTDAGTMNILIDGECVGEFPYISNLVGSINFFPTSNDGAPALYYLDDIVVTSFEELPLCESTTTPTFQTSCDYIGDDGWVDIETGIYAGSDLMHPLGASVSEDVVLHVPEVLIDPTTESAFAVMAWENLTVSGMPDGLSFDNFPSAVSGNNQLCLTYSGAPLVLDTFDVEVSGEMILDFFGSPYQIGTVSSTLTIVIEPNPNPIPGCTYAHAVNHSPIANVDDGSCIFGGCTDPSASNYEATASVNDGSCNSEPCDDGSTSNMGDLNGDGFVGAGDLLQFLSVFGATYIN